MMNRRLMQAAFVLWVVVTLVLTPARTSVGAAGPMLKITPSKVANEMGRSEIWWNERTGLQGIWVYAEGVGFRPGLPVKLVPLPGSEAFWSEACLNGINGEGYTPGPDGAFRTLNLDIVIPSPVGTYGLKAIQGDIEAVAYVEVRPPTPISVTITPDSVYPGQLVTVDITGLWPDQDPASVTVHTMFGETTPPGSGAGLGVSYAAVSEFKSLSVPPDGSVSLTWAVGTSDGTPESRFRSGIDDRPCTFIVEQAGRKPVAVPVKLKSGAPTLRLEPESVPCGGYVTVVGYDFTPGLPVTLSAEDAATGIGVAVEHGHTPTWSYSAGVVEVVPSNDGTFSRRINPVPLGPSGKVRVVAKQVARPTVSAYVDVTESQEQTPAQQPALEGLKQAERRPVSNLRAVWENGGVRLMWDAPEGAQGRVKGYYVYRSPEEYPPMHAGIRVHDFPITETVWIDRTVVSGSCYSYQVQTLYDDGLPGVWSGAVTVRAGGPSKTIVLRIGERKAKVSESGREVERELLVAPVIRDGRTCVPLRFIGEAMGANLEWDGVNKMVTYTLGERQVVLWVGQTRVVVNGLDQEYTPAPFIVDGATLVPVRLVAEALGFSVSWDGSTATVTIAR